ncbi:trimeric intracellular cation channel family protein [Sphingorhabdus sp.]|uniref:trimeric intracellular cation channel family protein n=1 Tax=Sphingorhabdus sp. TaxID=1902408 RepID=UPI003D812B48
MFGTWKSLTLGVPLLPAMMMGVITACVGGIIRDVLAGEPSILLKPEIYVTAAALAAGLFGSLLWVGLPILPAAIISACAGFTLRAMAILKGWAIPAYKN